MGKFETLTVEELDNTNIRVSRKSGSKQNWKHLEFNSLPSLTFDFDDTDARFSGKSEELRLYRNDYWAGEFKPGPTRKFQYERDLREAVLEAIQNVEDKWKIILADDLKKDFK